MLLCLDSPTVEAPTVEAPTAKYTPSLPCKECGGTVAEKGTSAGLCRGCLMKPAVRLKRGLPCPDFSGAAIAPRCPTNVWATSTDGNMKEYIDSTDHGRQLQSAAGFDVDKDHGPETFNPTEAGSRDDGAGAKSSSKLLRLRADGPLLETTTQMAFWLAPGEKSDGQFARNDKVLSDCTLTKRVHIGYKELPHAIEYEVTFTLPAEEKHVSAQLEALTGYMPAEFSRFWTYNIEKGVLEELSDGPGEQARPVVFSTADDAYAMGVYSPDQPSRGWEKVGYGRFRLKEDKVNKWNCAFRVANPKGLAPGDYRFRMFVAVGTLEDVKATLKRLMGEFKSP